MFNSKNKSSKIASSLLLTGLLLVATLSSSHLAKANFGQDLLAGIGCDDQNKDGGLNFLEDCLSGSDSSTVTSFTDFKGDLSAPNPEGYAPGLTQAQDARTFILNVTNFALGFLGLLAVLVIVYGGVLNVTAAGDPGKAEKGKKAITFSVIGLLIVMSSFAIVNTVLLAPSGSEKGSSSTIGSTTTIRGVAANQRFNYLSDQIEKALKIVYNSYQFHFTVKQEIDNAIAALTPLASGQDCFVPASNCANQYANTFQTSYVSLSNLINNPNANARFATGMSSYLNKIANEYNTKIATVRTLILTEDCDTENTFIDSGNPCTPDNLNKIKTDLASAATTAIASFKNATFINESATEDLNSAVTITATVFKAVSGLASDKIGLEYFQKLIPTFAANPSGTAPTAVSAEGSNSSFVILNEKLITQLQPGASLDNIDLTDIKSVLSNLIQIASVLKNIKFVNTVISADIVKGNAPLIVNFSSVGTTDPSGRTVVPENIKWDLNGDGVFSGETGEKSKADLGLQSCDEKSGAVASCTFSKPGTYRVSLKALPDANAVDQSTGIPYAQEIAPGISYIDILVSPPSTKINLEVASGSTKRPIIKYDGTGNLIEDHSQVYFTLSEAKAGLTFDASKSTLSDGSSQLINDPTAKIRWNFGVQSENNDTYQIPSKDKLSITQAYPATGNYQVKFEVTDKNGVVDRKIFTVIVSNLAPRISNPPLSGKVGEEMIFDGSDSTSDGGPIIFNWKVEKVDIITTASLKSLFAFNINTAHAVTSAVGAVSALDTSLSVSQLPPIVTVPVKVLEPTKRFEENEAYKCFMPEGINDVLKCTFKKAGNYKITLSLDDNGTAREESVLTTIASTAPTAAFKMVKLSPSAPALYKLDASSLSFDPDEKDNAGLEYSWEINPSNCNVIGFADQSSEGVLIKMASDATSAQIPCAKLKEFSHTYNQPVVKFTQKGEYAVGLTVRSFDETKVISETAEQPLTVDNVLDVAWGNMKPSAILKVPGEVTSKTGSNADQLPSDLNKQPQAEIKFIFVSSQAISYELDFGDGNNDSGDMTANVPKEVTHNYSKTGKFIANLSVFDADDIENKLSRKIFIGNSDTPVAIITTNINGNEVQAENLELDNGTVIDNVIKVNRADNISFDADKAINTDGTARRLLYSWNINANDKQATTKQVSYKFTELSQGTEPYVAKLKVTNERDPSQVGEDSVNIMVVGEQPTLRSLTAVAAGSGNTTPVQVKLTAVGAEDEDGQVVQYKWWYYNADGVPSPDERKGLQITTVPTATLTLGTNGEEGQKKRYRFGVEMTDNDNITVSTDSQNEVSRLNIIPPQIEVVNGPNKAPISKFTVDRTSINLGESVNFTSSSTDPDKGGSIKEYRWDFGDGTKGENKSSVSHTYKKANVDGYRAKLTVIDNNSSEATSDPIRIFVDANAEPPVAAFTIDQTVGSKSVKFKNTSTADSAAGSKLKKYSWDFDIVSDSNGDGKKDNDIDSGDQNPSYTYPNFGIYRAKLTVEDDQGQSRSITNFVNVKPAAPSVKPTGTTTNTNSSTKSSSSSSKTVGANLFEASTKVDTGLLLASIGAYAILFLVSRKKQQDNKNKIK